ncbi:MAG: hypothetical protein ACLS89_07925, partial [Collinsella sp.]
AKCSATAQQHIVFELFHYASFLRSGYRAGTQHIVEGSELKFISWELMGVCKPDWYWIEKMPVQMER